MELFGCGTALITPFLPDGAVDDRALEAHINQQIEQGVELLVPCGTTGEASTLSEAEWLHVITLTCAVARGRVPVFAGATHNATAAAVARAEILSSVPGLTGILTANPFYNRPSQEGQYQHFRAIAQATSLPVMLYNIPARTGANLEPATVLRLAQIHNIIGIKESSGNMVQIAELLTQAPRHFRVFAGDDALALPTLALGAAGLISVASNVIPQPLSDMVRAALRNDFTTARRIHRQVFRLLQALFWEPSPAPVKAVLSMMGTCEETLRLPMTTVSVPTRHKLETMAGEMGLLVHAPHDPSDNLRMF